MSTFDVVTIVLLDHMEGEGEGCLGAAANGRQPGNARARNGCCGASLHGSPLRDAKVYTLVVVGELLHLARILLPCTGRRW